MEEIAKNITEINGVLDIMWILIAGALVCALILAAHFGKIRRAK